MVESVVQRQYDRLAPIYDRRWRGYVLQTLNFFCDWIGLQPGQSVLDVACGTGELERLLLARQPGSGTLGEISGVDLSAKMLQQAREKCPSVDFRLASATQLPFANGQFDRVVSGNAFHYFEPAHQALAEMVRVTRPGGQILILDWCRDDWLCQLCDWGLKLVDPAHRQCYTQAELHALLRQQGLIPTAHRRIRFGWWGLMVVTCQVEQVIKSASTKYN